MTRAAVVVTGDEVLEGRVGDRNGRFLAADLDERGVEVQRIVILGDDRAVIARQVASLIAEGTDLVVTTGGLGVTHDDLTMAAVADAAGVGLRLDEDALAMVRARSAGAPNRDRVSAAVRDRTERKQAMLPEGGMVIPPVGTAPGCVLAVGGAQVVVLPGPPREASGMWASVVRDGPVARLLERAPHRPRRVLRVHGVVEAQLVERLGDRALDGLRMGICARPGEVEVVLTETGARPGAADALAAEITEWFGAAVFSTDGVDVEHAVADALRRAGHTVAVAESCTGGLLGGRFTSLAGSSAYFVGGVIAYSDDVKRGVLGVDAELLRTNGAVSAPCAAAMADGARRLMRVDWALSLTGIAGPGGGTPEKPVGLVYIGCAGPGGTRVAEHRFRTDRDGVRDRAVAAALHMLREAVHVGV